MTSPSDPRAQREPQPHINIDFSQAAPPSPITAEDGGAPGPPVSSSSKRNRRRGILAQVPGTAGFGLGLAAVLVAIIGVASAAFVGSPDNREPFVVEAAAELEPAVPSVPSTPVPTVRSSIELLVAVEVADESMPVAIAPGPEILAATPMEWAYTLTNTGETDLEEIVVIDPRLIGRMAGPICSDAAGARLAPGETVVCTATMPAVAGIYESQARVTARPLSPQGAVAVSQVSSLATSWYIGLAPR